MTAPPPRSPALDVHQSPDIMSFIVNPYRFSGGSAPWSPMDMDSLILFWLDAMDSATISHTSGAVTEWRDKSSTANHFEAWASGREPSWNLSNLVQFDRSANTSMRTLNTFGDTQMSTIDGGFQRTFFAAVLAYYNGNVGFKFETDASNRFGFEGSNRWDFPDDQPGSGRLDGWSATLDATLRVMVLVADGANKWVYLDGAQVATQAQPGNISLVAQPMYIGSNLTATSADGTYDFGSLIQGKDNIDTDTRQKLEGYLAHRWGIQANLPGGHPYKVSPP